MFSLLLTLVLIDPKPMSELPAPPLVEIAGWYQLTAGNPSEELQGAVLIRAGKEPDSYALRWYTDGGITPGVAIRDGNTLHASWTDGRTLGLIRYRIELEKDQPKLIAERGSKEVLTWLRGSK